jgi:hypothetical protein
MIARFQQLISELSRRKVFRATGVYLVGLWLASQGIADLFPAFGLPDWSVRAFVIAGISAIPLVIVVAWIFDITPRGVERDPVDAGREPPPAQSTEIGGWETAAEVPIEATWTSATGAPMRRRFLQAFVVGRDFGADVQLSHPRVSRRHLRVFPQDGRWRVEDLDSSNGTWLDGERITAAAVPQYAVITFRHEGAPPQLELQVQAALPTEISRG